MSISLTKTKLTESDVAEMLAHIPPPVPHTNSREEWLKVVASTCDALDGDEAAAIRLLKNWQEEWEPNAYETAIKSFHGNYKCKARTLVYLAKKGGYDASAKAKERAARERPVIAKKDTKTPAASASAEKPSQERRTAAAPAVNAAAAPREHASRAARVEKTDGATARLLLGKCSIVESCRKPETVKETDLLACLRAVKEGRWKNEVEAARAGKREKSTLPQVCAFGVYSSRRADENLMTRSGFLVLDYDGKDNPQTDFRDLRARLAKMPFTLAVFRSPSGNGLKALIRVPENVSDAAAFDAARTILAPLGGKLDAGTEARKHFIVSYDDEAFINETPLEAIPPLAPLEQLDAGAIAALFAETVEKFYFAGTEDYFFNDSGTIKKLSVSAAAQEFEEKYGASRKVARKALYAVRKSRFVHRVFPALTCHNAGLHVFDKKPVLVLSSPEIIESDEGNFPTICRLLKTVFNDDEQLERFLAWMQRARFAFLRACASDGANITPTPVLMLLGTAGAGKDLVFQTIIRPSLGDRQHAAADTFPQEKQWLGGIMGSECILASEMQDLNRQERSRFKATIKQIIGGSGYNAESKGKDSFTFRGQHFVIILVNIDDGGNCAAACPEISADFTDKFLALSLNNSAAVKAAFDGEHAQENAAAIRRELPAFLYWLETRFEVRAEWRDERFGLKGYCAPAASRALFDVSIDFDVLAKLDEIAATDDYGNVVERPLTATRIASLISSHFSERVIPPRVIGGILRRLAKEFPQKITWNGSNSSPTYKIARPQRTDADESEPASEQTAAQSPFYGLPF